MFYIILIIIVVVVYLIYKSKQPSQISKAKAKEGIEARIEWKEDYLLKKIKERDLREDIQNGIEVALFDCGKHNFICLSERYKHGPLKLDQINDDWLDYMQILSQIVTEMDILNHLSAEDGPKHFDERQKLYIRMQEINKRFKDLLGTDYWDPEECKKIRQTEINNQLVSRMLKN